MFLQGYHPGPVHRDRTMLHITFLEMSGGGQGDVLRIELQADGTDFLPAVSQLTMNDGQELVMCIMCVGGGG